MTCPRSANRHSTATSLAEPESLRDLAVARSIGKARARAEHRTTLLIDAALDLVAERGSLEFTVQEVVARAQLSLHAFYQLFESKDALIEAVLEESFERGVLALRELVDDETEPVDRLRAFVVGYFELATSSGQPHARLRPRVPDARARTSPPSLPRSRGRRTDRCACSPTSCCAPPTAEHEVRTDLDIDRLAGFILLSVSTVTELAIDEPEQRWPDGEQLWQLIAQGVVR